MTRTNKLHPSLYALLLAFGVLLGACSDPPPEIELSGDGPLLAFGDSITRGTGANRDASYPAVLSRLSGHEVINAGVPGETTAGGLQRLPGLLDQHKPSLLILCHGGNDFLRRLDPAQTKSNLAAMIESAEARGIPVLLMGVPALGLMFLESAELYEELAQEYALPYEAEVVVRVETDPELKSDRVHPNADGYREIATAVYELLQKTGALAMHAGGN